MSIFKKIGSFFGNVGKQIGTGVKNIGKQIGSAVRKVTKNIGSTVKKGFVGILKLPGKLLKIAALAPFKRAMTKALDRRGIQYGDLNDIAQKFYHYIIRKQNYDAHTDHLDPVTIAALIPIIMKFFQSLQAKADKGEALPGEEADMLETAAQDTENMDMNAYLRAAVDQGNVTTDGKGNVMIKEPSGIGSFIEDNKVTIIVIIVAIIALAIWYKNKKK